MRFAVDPAARSPLFRQLQDQIRYAISVGDLVPGDALPSIRVLESRLDVNRNTVRRAYLELQLEGTLIMRPGRETVVAERPPAEIDPRTLGEATDGLVAAMLQRAESMGVDSKQLAECVASAAAAHDDAYPRCAFLECSQRQSDYMARRVARRFGRRVVGVDLHDLERDASVLPPSVRFVLTPHWHAAEANRHVLAPRHVFAVGVRISAECGKRLGRIRSDSVGLVVRDAESLPGFRERVQSHLGSRSVRAVLAGDVDALASLMNDVKDVVYTSPCADAVATHATARVSLHELLFDPTAEELDDLRTRLFPSLVEKVQAA